MKINSYVPSEELFKTNFNNGKIIDSNATDSTGGTSSVSFADTLKNSLDKVNTEQVQAESAVSSYVKGDSIDIADVMLKNEEAKMSLQYAVQVRNKLVDAYQEIAKMQM